MRIARDIYLEKLKRGIGNGMIKVITGIRRCGKSYLLFELFREYLASIGTAESHIIEVALDDRANAALRDPDAMLAYVKSRITDSGRYFILLDEVQCRVRRCPQQSASYPQRGNLCHGEQFPLSFHGHRDGIQRSGI